jgi:hypothetical protein
VTKDDYKSFPTIQFRTYHPENKTSSWNNDLFNVSFKACESLDSSKACPTTSFVSCETLVDNNPEFAAGGELNAFFSVEGHYKNQTLCPASGSLSYKGTLSYLAVELADGVDSTQTAVQETLRNTMAFYYFISQNFKLEKFTNGDTDNPFSPRFTKEGIPIIISDEGQFEIQM